MWPLFRPFPPLGEIKLTMRDLVAYGALVQRELVELSKFSSEARARGFASVDRDKLERWDRDGRLSPIAFVRGGWGSHSTTDPYPTEGIEFRDEAGFRPWSEYEYDEYGFPTVQPLYSEWQLLYLPIARESSTVPFPVEVVERGPERAAEWMAENSNFFSLWTTPGPVLEERWAPTIRLLIRLQARYWPYVRGQGTMLIDPASHDYVDPLDIEYQTMSASDVAESLGIDAAGIEALYTWFADRGYAVDPASRLFDLTRLERRRDLERDKGPRRQALDLYDAASMLRRFHRELTDKLLPDVDQLQRDPEEEARPLGRRPEDLDRALRRHRLYPHRLHIVAEGETEVRLIKKLFEAFAGQPWEGSGLRITDLGGDKLEGSRTMIEGFGGYAQDVALLLDDENEARRVSEQFKRAELAPSLHVTLCEPSLEEENFSDDELVALAQQLASDRGVELKLTAAELRESHGRRNRGRKRPKGLAEVLVEEAAAPARGSVVIKKVELADAMADLLIKEIEDAPGRHDEVAEKRPIVRWVLALSAARYTPLGARWRSAP